LVRATFGMTERDPRTMKINSLSLFPNCVGERNILMWAYFLGNSRGHSVMKDI
jgi:hypothetical protein